MILLQHVPALQTTSLSAQRVLTVFPVSTIAMGAQALQATAHYAKVYTETAMLLPALARQDTTMMGRVQIVSVSFLFVK